jgi:hypothetical protein
MEWKGLINSGYLSQCVIVNLVFDSSCCVWLGYNTGMIRPLKEYQEYEAGTHFMGWHWCACCGSAYWKTIAASSQPLQDVLLVCITGDELYTASAHCAAGWSCPDCFA